MVIWPEFRMGQYRVNYHPYHAPQFMIYEITIITVTCSLIRNKSKLSFKERLGFLLGTFLSSAILRRIGGVMFDSCKPGRSASKTWLNNFQRMFYRKWNEILKFFCSVQIFEVHSLWTIDHYYKSLRESGHLSGHGLTCGWCGSGSGSISGSSTCISPIQSNPGGKSCASIFSHFRYDWKWND